MNDDTIVRRRISGRSVRAIAEANGIALADVNRALALFTEARSTTRFASIPSLSSFPDSMSFKKS